MRLIKTIRSRLGCAKAFDEEVNKALMEGWVLRCRVLFLSKFWGQCGILYAKLDKEV